MYTDIYGIEHRYSPPQGWVQRDGVERFDADEEWQRLCERGLQFEPYSGRTSICWARGPCLEPLLTEKHLFRTRPVAPDEQLIDGGLYIFEAPFKSEGNPEEIKAYCDLMGVPVTSKNTVMKFLRFICGEWRYQCNQGVGSLAGCKGVVISQVVAVLPCPESGTATVTCDTSQSRANAATDIVSTSLGSFVGTAIAQAMCSVSVAAKSLPYVATVTVSADVWKTSANSAQCWLNTSTGPVVSQGFQIQGTASPGTRIGIVFSWAIAAATAATFSLFYNSATVGNFGNAANIDIRVDVVKL